MLERTINYSARKLSFSFDGTVLGASPYTYDYSYAGEDRSLNFYSLPSGTMTSSFPFETQPDGSPYLLDFTLSASGTTIGQVTTVYEPGLWQYTRSVTPISGQPAIWSDTGVFPILLSPDGTLLAASTSLYGSTNIFKNGTFVSAVPGFVIGWLDNDRLLVNHYTYASGGNPMNGWYTGCNIYSSAGVQLSTPSTPELDYFQTVTTDSVYEPSSNSIYSLTTGQPAWKGSLPINSGDWGAALHSYLYIRQGVGAVAGPYVVYASGHSVIVETF